jgi:hypothetical protein
MWKASKSSLGQCDVIPMNDLHGHTYGEGCSCGPRNQGGIWVHNSFDGREILERAKESVSGN